MSDTAIALLQHYDTYTGSDGKQHLSRVDPAVLEWVIQAKNAKTYHIKFEKNFSKKHLFTPTKQTDRVEAEIKRLWGELSFKAKTYWVILKRYWRSYPPQFVDQALRNLEEAKLIRQAGHRTPAEQGICKTCGHVEKRHKTGGGNATPCKETSAGSKCNCAPYISSEPYKERRQAEGRPTPNPLAGATTTKTTYVLMHKIPLKEFEEVVTDAIVAGEGGSWAVNTEKEIHWDFKVKRKGCVLTVDTTKPATDWVKAQGIKVKIANRTTNPAQPTYAVCHLHGTI